MKVPDVRRNLVTAPSLGGGRREKIQQEGSDIDYIPSG